MERKEDRLWSKMRTYNVDGLRERVFGEEGRIVKSGVVGAEKQNSSRKKLVFSVVILANNEPYPVTQDITHQVEFKADLLSFSQHIWRHTLGLRTPAATLRRGRAHCPDIAWPAD